MYLALKKANVPSELHIYTTGGHSYGVRKTDLSVSNWPDHCAAWLKDLGMLTR